MADKTGIEWTDATWNPVTGCTKVSQGCKHCYADREWSRMTKLVKAYKGRDFSDVMTHGDRLDQPIRWVRPRMIFVNSMGDLFHEAVPDEFIDNVFGVMWACLYNRKGNPGHVFQVLTKRAERMRDYMKEDRREAWANAAVMKGGGIDPDGMWDQVMNAKGPHPRIWLGVSAEDQETADERIPLLLQTQGAVRFVSMEPLLGPVELNGHEYTVAPGLGEGIDWLTGNTCQHSSIFGGSTMPWLDRDLNTFPQDHKEPRIHWVIVGGESGPNARPMHPDWVRDIRDQCETAGVPFLFKQWGEWVSEDDVEDGVVHQGQFVRVGRRTAGRSLDGREHNEYPEHGMKIKG